jgi:hypothetical protein
VGTLRQQWIVCEHVARRISWRRGGLLRQKRLFPRVVDERVECGCPPVDGLLVVRLDGEDPRPLLREVDSPVVRLPDVLDADRRPGLGREIPVLPVEELGLGDAVPARGDERGHRERRADEDLWCATARGRPEARDERERSGKDEHTSTEVVVPGEDRRRPARAGHEHEAREQRTARGDGQRRQRREDEDCEQDDPVHEAMRRGVERHEHVVEVEEPSAGAAQDASEGVRPDVERDRPRRDQRYADSGEAQAARGQKRRSDPEQDHEQDRSSRAVRLEASPVPGDQDAQHEREGRRLSHLPRAPPRAR